ncbi:MAG TPA: DUF5666 domain-containing protein [Silvibacterium sp.]|nr:DUF5666 domain-containing protein [Silvibacterium sp.]
MRSAGVTISVALLYGLALTCDTPCPALLFAQAATQATPQAVRIVGTVTAIDGKALTIKSDAGATTTVGATDATRVLRAEPGAKSLSEATPAQLADIAVGDRVLVAATPADGGSPGKALRIVAMKQGDIAQKQKAEQADWQRRGIGGLVKSVDPAASTISIAAGSRTILIHTTPQTIFRRYDAASIKFSDAKPSSMDQIHPGDQLRARGNRSADGGELVADEVVAGSFRNIAGTVNSVDEASNTITVTDLATKKQVVIHVTPDSQMHKLPAAMAQAVAARMKNPNGAAPTAGTGAGAGAAGGHPATTGSGAGQQQSEAGRQGASGQSGGPGGQSTGPGGQRSGDLSQMLQRTPTVQLSDLHKGDAVMIVATQGTPEAATAVTLVAGVEPILTAPASASQSMFSASWNLGGGGAAESAGTP